MGWEDGCFMAWLLLSKLSKIEQDKRLIVR